MIIGDLIPHKMIHNDSKWLMLTWNDWWWFKLSLNFPLNRCCVLKKNSTHAELPALVSSFCFVESHDPFLLSFSNCFLEPHLAIHCCCIVVSGQQFSVSLFLETAVFGCKFILKTAIFVTVSLWYGHLFSNL